jgi:hypothetical protein
VLLVDGLEKSTEEMARRIVSALLDVADEGSLIVVVPPSLVNGPTSYELLNRAKVFSIGAVCVVEGEKAGKRSARDLKGHAFLQALAEVRLDSPVVAYSMKMSNVFAEAATMSGGIVREFLQLLRDANRYAALVERMIPSKENLTEAAKDHAEHLERLLGPGDLAALRAADGTSGAEIQPIERRLRFLVHGLLLEYKIGGRTVVHPAPLLKNALSRKDAT